MSDPIPGGAAPSAWFLAGLALLALYRGAMAALLAAHQGLVSLQRRRLLEEGAFPDQLLARLQEDPRGLTLELVLWNQLLFVGLLGASLQAGSFPAVWILLASLAYVWLLDAALPALLVSRDPAAWLCRLFPMFRPAHPLLALLLVPVIRRLGRDREEQEVRKDAPEGEVSGDAVTALLEEGEAEGILEAEDREMIRNVVSFGDTVVREVMTPRTGIRALPLEATAQDAWEAFRESRHSRLPVFEGSLDRVAGILLLKDLLQHPPGQDVPVASLLKAPLFVPESKPVQDLLREMQRTRVHLAVVVDEFGGMSGLVTVEDLLEEVVGEIRDEHEGPPEIVETAPGIFEVSAQIHVEDLEDRLGLTWEREGFDTLGGLVMARLGRVPAEGDAVAVEGARLEVLRMDGARTVLVRVRKT
ncbi:MAG: HlyC/CorC family transporter [Acidobacteria bacterium]|nr:HlyC/CorC family transporter [Acidobacteriota bacterium]